MTINNENRIVFSIPIICTILSLAFVIYGRFDDSVCKELELKVNKETYELQIDYIQKKLEAIDKSLDKIDKKIDIINGIKIGG